MLRYIHSTFNSHKERNSMSDKGMARLLIRGHIINSTAKNLSQQETEEVAKHVEVAWNDSELIKTKGAFCSKLSWYVGGEYLDPDIGLQEARIVFWRTTIDLLFHRPKRYIAQLLASTCSACKKHRMTKCQACSGTDVTNVAMCPKCDGTGFGKPEKDGLCECGCATFLSIDFDPVLCSISELEQRYEAILGKRAPSRRGEAIINNVAKRRKFYKTHLWNYYIEIVNKNKKAGKIMPVVATLNDYAEKVATVIVKEILSESKLSNFTETISGNMVRFDINTNLLPSQGVRRLHEIADLLAKKNVEIVADETGITVTRTGVTDICSVAVKKNAVAAFVCLSNSPQDFSESTVTHEMEEPAAISFEDLEITDSLRILQERLSPLGHKIFNLIMHPPEDYKRQYSSAKKSSIGKYLGLSKQDLEAAWRHMQLAAMSAGLTPGE